MNVIEVIKSRRSIRKFKDKPVPNEIIDKILEIPDNFELMAVLAIGYPDEKGQNAAGGS